MKLTRKRQAWKRAGAVLLAIVLAFGSLPEADYVVHAQEQTEASPESEETKAEPEETKAESEERQTESEEKQTESEEKQTESEEKQTESEEMQTESEEEQTESEEEQTESEEEQTDPDEKDEVEDDTAIAITAWEWIDEEDILDPETGSLSLPGANKNCPASFDDVVALLPTQILATVENEEDAEAESEETITLKEWSCEEYPEKGAYTGSYTFAAALPEGYVLSEEAEALTVLVELGGAQMYEGAESETVGAFTVTGGTKDTDYTYTDGVLTIKSDMAITIANTEPSTSTTDRIEVESGISANITLAGVNIDVSSLSGTAAFKIADDSSGDVTIILADDSENTLKSGENCAGLQKNGNGDSIGKLTIQGGINGTGKLNATGGLNGAGIGGGFNGSGSSITISGGTVTATGANTGAGIGGGFNGSGSSITISGGTVTATGANPGAGIGGGGGGDGLNITISGGTVTATGGLNGAGIGGGYSGAGENIEISGGTVTATGGRDGAGIGGSCRIGSKITISGGTVTATGGDRGAGIGGGFNGSGSSITISGGTVTATGGEKGAGIGGGYDSSSSNITISGGTVTATGGEKGAGIGGGSGRIGSGITISGGVVTAIGNSGGAGIGGGDGGSSLNITMDGDVVLYVSSFDRTPTFTQGVVYEEVAVSGDAGSYTLTGGVGTVYGNPGVSGFTKPEGSKLGTNLADTDCITVTVPDVDYTGLEAVVTATVTVDKIALGGKKTLVQGTDYTVSVSDSDKINAGAKRATITAVEGSGNVNETTKAFNVKPVELSIAKIEMSLSGIPDGGYVYDSTAKEPEPAVTWKRADGSEYTLIKDTDYTVSYSNHTDAYELLYGDDGYESDKAPTVTVTAKDGGNFTGSRSMNFTIQPAPMSDIAPDIAVTPYSSSYDGVGHPVVGTDGITGLAGEDNTIYYSTDDKATWSTTVPTITNAGTFHFYVKVTKPNYKDWISEKLTAEVSRKLVTVTAEDKTKTYGEDNPELTFTVPAGALAGTDTKDDLGVTLSCEATKASPVKEGGYAITGTSDSANYNVTVTPGTLTIEKANAEITVGTETYNKTFGDADFTLDVTDTNTEADVQYRVTDSKDAAGKDVANDAVVTVDENGTVTIHGAGTATIVLSLPESTNYHAAQEKTVSIRVIDMPDGLWMEEISDQTYNGKAIKPEVEVYYDRQLLTAGKDYTVSYRNNTNAAAADAVNAKGASIAPTVTIKGKGNFSGTVTKTFTIKPINLDNYKTDAQLQEILSIEPVYAKYSGKVIKTAPTVKLNGKKLALSAKQYTCEYNDENPSPEQTAYKDCGTYNITIVGSGKNFVGTTTVTETISEKLITRTKLTSRMITQINKSFLYDGTEHSVVKDTDYTIKDGETTLKEGQDYTLTYTGDRTHAGTFKVTFSGTGAYSGTVTKSFTIRKASVSTLEVTLPDSGSVVYTKGGTKPEPEVRFNGELLTEGTDYTVTYKNNTKTASAEDTKAPYLYITGKGNFTGNTKDTPVKFTIVAAPLDAQTIVVDNVPYKNKNNNFVPTVTITDSTTGKKLAKKTDYLGSFTYEIWDTDANGFVPFDDKKVEASEDTIRMRVTISGTGNYTGTARTEYEICPKSITSVRVEKIPNQEYTGQAITPKLTITDNGKELTEGTDYTLEYSNNTKKGTATVTIRGKGQYGGSKTVKFKITSRIFKWF